MDKLSKLLEGKSIAIVGPSPHLTNLGLGKRIDSYDIVIRINEILSKKSSKDYGSKNDLIFVNLNDDFLDAFKGMVELNLDKVKDVSLFVSPRNSLHISTENRFELDEKKNVFKQYKKLNLNNDFYHIGDEKNKELESKVTSYPSTGLLALMLISEVNFSELYVCGFSFYSTSFAYSPERTEIYNSRNHQVSNISGHDMLTEINYLREHFPKNKNIKVDKIFDLLIYKKIKYKYIKYFHIINRALKIS
tara:strand:+ start:37686 stop:38429 length:744 start_codon:yes stop_codon:yes gene_type:complete